MWKKLGLWLLRTVIEQVIEEKLGGDKHHAGMARQHEAEPPRDL